MTDTAAVKISASIASSSRSATKSRRTMNPMVQWPISWTLFFFHRLWEGGSEMDFPGPIISDLLLRKNLSPALHNAAALRFRRIRIPHKPPRILRHPHQSRWLALVFLQHPLHRLRVAKNVAHLDGKAMLFGEKFLPAVPVIPHHHASRG